MNSGAAPSPLHLRSARTAAVAATALVVSLLLYTAYAASSGSSPVPKECRRPGSSGQGADRQTDGEKKAPHGSGGRQGAARADFDGDGHADLASGSPGGDMDGKRSAGYVSVIYGSGDDEKTVRCEVLTQVDEGVPGETADEALFGEDPVARDFDDDGYTDLAVATSRKADGSGVVLLWGSARGLGGGTAVQDAPHHQEGGEPQLAAGDFDGDGKADLALEPGSEHGLLKGPFDRDGRPAGTEEIPAPELPDDPTGTLRVSDLVSGDVDGDGAGDLVAFHSDDDGESSWSELTWAGNYYKGGRDGFAEPDSERVPDGETAVIGDVDKDGHGDLVVSPRGENVSRGAVEVAYGTEDGPGKRTQTIDADTPGVPGDEADRNDDDVFTTLDAGDVDGDGYADVAAGAQGSGVGDVGSAAGTVLLLRGGGDGLTGEGAALVDERDVGAKPETEDRFGLSVRLSDTGGDRRADLAVSAPWEGSAPGGGRFRGSVWTVPGGDDGPVFDAASVHGPGDFGLWDEESSSLGEEFAR